ncbi:hypothetical protein BKM31_31780 [[Actinomadura] parvosata subsp. kistnae]|uniref:Uncharacterized protein n=1 Tax=[Actinomadura] parvosata subsp. kistnae TaxID=1909395 RepID=A0A1V0A5G1_9ACTN|nr:hypothetical protein BKM31_31780 [Nonomuraea sp. ATCC 55076]
MRSRCTTIPPRKISVDQWCDAGDQHDHEGVQGDLAQQERPVVVERLAHRPVEEPGAAEPIVQRPDQ